MLRRPVKKARLTRRRRTAAPAQIEDLDELAVLRAADRLQGVQRRRLALVVVYEHEQAVAGQGAGDGATDAARGAGDQGDAAVATTRAR